MCILTYTYTYNVIVLARPGGRRSSRSRPGSSPGTRWTAPAPIDNDTTNNNDNNNINNVLENIIIQRIIQLII